MTNTDDPKDAMLDADNEAWKEASAPLTIADVGQLWMGHPDSGDKSLEFKDWDNDQEDELATLLHDNQEKFEGGRVGRRASYILQHLTSEIGGQKLWEQKGDDWTPLMTLPQRLAAISRLWTVDVLTAYILLRIRSGESPMVTFPISDPYDRKGERTVDWKGDLSKLPFEGSPVVADQLWTVDLKHPFKIFGKTADKLVMGPTRWAVTEKLEILNQHQRHMNLDQVAGAIWEIPSVTPNRSDVTRATYSRRDIGKMRKVDTNEIVRLFSENHNGLDSSIEVPDVEKKRTFDSSVPWYRPDFFDVTSQ